MTKEKLLQFINVKPLPNHIAIIMDGNGRWAKNRGLTRNMGHQKGAKVLYEIYKECFDLGIKCLTVYAFSTENWNRPKEEIDYIFSEFKKFYETHHDEIKKHNTKVKVIGEKTHLDEETLKIINEVESSTMNNNSFIFNIAFNYGSKSEIINACKNIYLDARNKLINIYDLTPEVFNNYLYTKDCPDIDLLIRTSGEFRISNFLLWQIAYSEIYITKTYWPDFHKKELYMAIYEYQQRNRRFGGLK